MDVLSPFRCTGVRCNKCLRSYCARARVGVSALQLGPFLQQRSSRDRHNAARRRPVPRLSVDILPSPTRARAHARTPGGRVASGARQTRTGDHRAQRPVELGRDQAPWSGEVDVVQPLSCAQTHNVYVKSAQPHINHARRVVSFELKTSAIQGSGSPSAFIDQAGAPVGYEDAKPFTSLRPSNGMGYWLFDAIAVLAGLSAATIIAQQAKATEMCVSARTDWPRKRQGS